MKGKIVYLLHKRDEGYAVIISNNEVETTVLPYHDRSAVNGLVTSYMVLGYAYRGVKRFEDLM